MVATIAAVTGGAGSEESIEPVLRGWGMSDGAAQFLAIALVVVPLTIITIIVGELVPKVFALRNKEWVCLTLSPAMQWFAYSVFPAVWLLEAAVTGLVKLSERGWSSRRDGTAREGTLQELRGAAALARMSRFIGHREEGIIVSASRLAATPLRKIMVPCEYIGMITLEDILEELVGEIHDEFDRIPAHLSPAGQGWIAGGFVALSHLRDVAGIELKPSSEKPIYTLHDWITERLGRPPRGGDEVVGDSCRVLVRKIRHILVQEAYLQKMEGQDA